MCDGEDDDGGEGDDGGDEVVIVVGVAAVEGDGVVVWVVRGDDDVVDWNGGGDVDVERRWRCWRYCVAVVWIVARRSRRK
ncbi:hypothetical protein Tco_1018974 [Tanacetum coccineum]|uniref:Uncharacterized protein n=1 Tax=Tanacetum coccineum TaxID=301880 RepID=A0ABQ5FW60_9ASTR